MELLSGKDADISLIIKPEEYCNMARFINGVNNNDENSCKKANVNTVRYNILGEPKILLYARRFIKIGESLLYDYNAALDKYPTDEFI
jgi:SET domain-containing protein